MFQQTERKVIRVAERGEDEEEFNAERSSACLVMISTLKLISQKQQNSSLHLDDFSRQRQVGTIA